MSIRALDLGRNYRQKCVFRDVIFELPDRSLTIVSGSNGSGKTTLLRILSTLISPSSGEAWVQNFSVTQEPEKVKSQIGYAPSSDGGFFRRMSGKENIYLFGGLRGMRRKQIDAAIDTWSELFELKEALKTPFIAASSGMRQTLAVLRALLHGPSVLLLDEPDRSLDPEAQRVLRSAIQNLAQKKTVLVTTHYPQCWENATIKYRLKDGVMRKNE